jgi:multidrug efflux pump subunit AcrB
MVIVLLGAFALRTLPINRYPTITPPSVQVSAVYPGATAEDAASAVASPIEQQLGWTACCTSSRRTPVTAR